MPRPPHYSWFDHPNNIWWWVQIINFLVMQYSPLPCHLVPLRPKYPPQHPQNEIISWGVAQKIKLKIKWFLSVKLQMHRTVFSAGFIEQQFPVHISTGCSQHNSSEWVRFVSLH
jgi:hypothetical protein